MCEFAPCKKSTDVLACETKPPASDNVISYSYTTCEGVPANRIAVLRCPIKCKKCTTPPNAYGSCPIGWVKIDGCCMDTTVGQDCTGTNPDGSCPLGFTTTTAGETNYCCPNPTPTPTPDGGGGHWECDPACYGDGGFAITQQQSSLDGGVTPNNVDHCCIWTPIIIDILGNGFDLTTAQNGTDFDFNGDGVAHKMSWTSAKSDDAWLVLDRNGNGTIDNGAELFGNMTPQPVSDEKMAFLPWPSMISPKMAETVMAE